MQYTVNQTNRRLEIFDEYGQHYGVINFNIWKPSKSEITTADGNTNWSAGTVYPTQKYK